jgi:hypothetical protein
MKRFLGAACILASLFAFSQPSWADPAPSQIQAEMATGHWQQAHDDLMLVLRDHPNSHKAQSMLATVDTHLAQQRNGGGIVPLNMASPQSHHGRWLPIVLLVVGIWLLFRFLRARQRRAMGGMYGPQGGQGFGGRPNPFNPNMGPPGYNPNQGYNPNMYPQQPPAPGGGMMSGIAGGLLGGVVAEELLGRRDQPVNETIINENGDNVGNPGNDSWDNNSNNDWTQQADNSNDDDNNSWT